MKTSELIGPALDWAVAKCEEVQIQSATRLGVAVWVTPPLVVKLYTPSTDWVQGGPIIEREGLNTFRHNKLEATEPNTWHCHKVVVKQDWRGDPLHVAIGFDGPTLLIAAMRCYVASKLGDEIEIPEELSK